ncbi:MAG: hypothetical protein RLN70_10675 [Rhodospirillaceae bacterium]
MALVPHNLNQIAVRETREGAAALSADLQNRIDRIWDEIQKTRNTPMANEPLFAVMRIEGNEVYGHFVEYKWFVAQSHDPGLFQDLQIRPLAVSGILSCPEGIVLGRRSANVTQNPSAWELVPSGGVDKSSVKEGGVVDLNAQILSELKEEIGLPASAVENVRCVGLIEDTDHHLFDAAMEVKTAWRAGDIFESFRRAENDEYSEIQIMPAAKADTLLGQPNQDLVPLSAFLIQRMRRA